MRLTNKIKNYVSGVLTPDKECNSISKEMHYVSIYGINLTEKYINVKNTWGESYGEYGYSRFSFGNSA